MLFANITMLDEALDVQERMYVGVADGKVAYIGEQRPKADYGTVYDGNGKLLMPGFYNAHGHTPMTLLRGYGENLPLQRWLNERIFPFEAAMRGEEAYWGMLLGLAESMRYGIVSTTDMYNFCEDMARALLSSGMKANIGRHIVCFDDSDLEALPCFKELDDFYHAYHGAGSGRLLVDAALHAEYTSTPGVARQLAAYAAENGLHMQLHLAETQAEAEQARRRHGVSAAQYLAEAGLFDVPATAAHCVWLEEDDFALLAEKGVTVASSPASNLKLASGVCDVPHLLRQGVPVALGTDSVASNNSLNMMEQMKWFALLHKGAGKVLDPTAITPKQALHAATAAGALAQGRAQSGRLAVGCHADLIVLDISGPGMAPVHDLLASVVYSACGGDVVLTMVDGRVLYQDGEYKTIDMERTVFEAGRAAKTVLERMG